MQSPARSDPIPEVTAMGVKQTQPLPPLLPKEAQGLNPKVPMAQTFHDDSAAGPLFQYQAQQQPPAAVISDLETPLPPATKMEIPTPSVCAYHPSLVDRICWAITGRGGRLIAPVRMGVSDPTINPAFTTRAAQNNLGRPASTQA